jgi:hypothetical protein
MYIENEHEESRVAIRNGQNPYRDSDDTQGADQVTAPG